MSQIPMAALVAVMIMVSIGTFNWDSIGIYEAIEELKRGYVGRLLSQWR